MHNDWTCLCEIWRQDGPATRAMIESTSVIVWSWIPSTNTLQRLPAPLFLQVALLLEALIGKYGIFAIFVGSAIEGETVAFLGGVTAHRHLLSFWAVACCAATGSFVADQFFFMLGRKASTSRHLRKVSSSKLANRIRGLLNRHPNGFVLGFRFVYGMRTISPIVIGLTGFPVGKFVLLNALAALAWGFIVSAAGYLFGSLITSLIGRVHLHTHLLFALTAAAFIIVCSYVAGRLLSTSSER